MGLGAVVLESVPAGTDAEEVADGADGVAGTAGVLGAVSVAGGTEDEGVVAVVSAEARRSAAVGGAVEVVEVEV